MLNSLEDTENHIRPIFTGKRLTEGWDVLNLFDIVRLYTGRDKGALKGQRVAGQAIVQEIQLIGRGIRYYPFTYNEHEKNKRKFGDESGISPIIFSEQSSQNLLLPQNHCEIQ